MRRTHSALRSVRGAVCRTVLAVGAVAAFAVTADAHGAVLDFSAIEARLASEAADPDTPPAEAKVYRALLKVLDKERASDSLASDIGKLAAVAKAVDGKLDGDRTLRNLLDDAIDEAEHLLAGQPDEVSIALGRVLPGRGRDKLEAKALAAYDAFTDGRDSRADRRAAVKAFGKSASGYLGVLAKAAKTVTRQGGPAPTTTPAEASRVYTFVGTGDGGFNGDGREARRTSLYFVDECAFGPDGRLYILDWNNHMVRCLEPDGTIARICGSGVPGDSEGEPGDTALNHPSALAFDAQGRVYLGAWHNHKVKVYDPTGAEPTVYTIAGTSQGYSGDGGLATDAKMSLTPGILRLPDGDILITDAANQVVRRIALSSPQQDTNVAGVTVTTGVITNFAGTPKTSGYSGDGGAATSALLTFSKAQNAEPDGRMARAENGDVYVVCGAGNVVRKIDAGGTITTFAGTGVAGYSGDGGAATSAQLDGPSDVAIGPGGVVYISDSNNHVIRRVDAGGTITTYAGLAASPGAPGDGETPAAARFHRPAGLETDAAGNLYVCDRYNNVIRVISSAAPGGLEVPVAPYALPLPAGGVPPEQGPSGTIDTYAGSGVLGFNGDGRPALDTELYWPQDVTVDPSFGLVYFCDWNNHRIRRVESNGTVATVIGSGQLGDTYGPAANVRLNHPTDLVFHPTTGELWIAGWHTDKLIRLDAASNNVVKMAGTSRSFSGDGGPALTAELNLPASLKFDAAGNWYVGDEGNRRVRYVDGLTSTISTIVGTGDTDPLGDDGPAASATLDLPVGQSAQPGGRVCLSPDDRYLYIADTNHHRVRRVDLLDPQRTITTIAGRGVSGFDGDGGQATAAALDSPVDVDCDAAGNVYIADRDNHAIRKVTVATGVISTVCGDGIIGYTGDKGAAADARLNQPSGIFVHRASGRIYVADTYNGVIRVIWE
ncbi:MAG: hypothetical protein HMLKMBBP_00569 [Planctomycetes bacterium]|nr:hypothetical protein [Planctomycetota bacterium]